MRGGAVKNWLLVWATPAAFFTACGDGDTPKLDAGISPERATEMVDDAGTQPEQDAGSYSPLDFSSIGAPVLISSAFYFTEGPVWDPAAGVLYFTDINAQQRVAPEDAGTGDIDAGQVNDQDSAVDHDAEVADGGALNDEDAEIDGAVGPEGGTPQEEDASASSDGAVESGTTKTEVGGAIYRLTPPDTIDLYLEPVGNADGLGLDPDGHLIAAGFIARGVSRLSDSNTLDLLAACASGEGSCYMDQPLNTPDDLTARSDGILYFTDPTFGSGQQGFPTLTLPLGNAQGVYRVTREGELFLEDESTDGPNGVNLSPDEKTLYVSYTLSGEVAKFDVSDDGSLSNKSVFATGATVADSMCVDASGNVYVGTLSGLAVYDPTGTNLGTISVDGQIVTNCAFGGDDQRTLYITARTLATLVGAPPLGGGSLYAISDMPVPGIPGQN